MKKIYIHFSIFVLFIAIILVVSGCGRKSPENLTPALSSEEREKAPLPPLQKGEVETATSSSEVAETATSTGEIPSQSQLTGGTATSTDEIDTSDWKVYKNEEYGFELRYPENFKIINNPEDWQGKKYEYVAIDLQSQDGEEKARMSIYPNGGFGVGLPWDEEIIKEKIKIDNKNALKFSFKKFYIIWLYTNEDEITQGTFNENFRIDIMHFGTLEKVKLFDKIVTTLKFID